MILLVCSGAYIEADLRTEFGDLPPSFLPVQNKRLFEHQFGDVPHGITKYLALPRDYEIEAKDQERLEQLQVEVIPAPTTLSLGEAIVFYLNFIGRYEEPLALLHGDTLIGDLDFGVTDHFSLGRVFDHYQWASVPDQPPGVTYAGLFVFANVKKLITCLLTESYKFLDAIEMYRREIDVNLEISDAWQDFGHCNTYYRSKALFSTERGFNNLSFKQRVFRKSSKQTDKIEGEVEWFKSIPAELQVFTPKLLTHYSSAEESGYDIEYVSLSTLSELFVFGRLPAPGWKPVFNACHEFLSMAATVSPPEPFVPDNLFGEKTITRLEQFARDSGVDIYSAWSFNKAPLPGLVDIATETAALIRSPQDEDIALIHGDFCFSNVLYDFRSQTIRVIDPRGVNTMGESTIFGDRRYDLAKFGHSVVGLYDVIVAGYYHLNVSDNQILEFSIDASGRKPIIDAFWDHGLAELQPERAELYPMLIQLFLSMLPLHSDSTERQWALLSNGLRLYQQLQDER